MLGGSLKDWLLQDPEHQWGLQVMLDTLAGRDLDELKKFPVDELADHLVMHVDRL